MEEELKKIKKNYGEDMMHFCKNYFPTVLEYNGDLYNILSRTFAVNKALLNDIKSKNLIGQFIEYVLNANNIENSLVISDKTPFEIFKSIGYTLYECKNSTDVDKFRKYYEPNEELCTFRDRGRIDKCYVFFAVRDDADSIKRSNFKRPQREDSYGTSVMSIQFTKGRNNYISIKNRYNHTVKNPDATYANNLENIKPGLTYSFQKYYGFNIDCNNNYFTSSLVTYLKYVKASNHKYYRYNYEINNLYYCDNNVIIKDHKLIYEYTSNKERYIVVDYFILDLKEKKVFTIDDKLHDSFIDTLDYDFKKIEVVKDKSIKLINLYIDEDNIINIKLDKFNRIIEYKNDLVETIGDNFMHMNKTLEKISLKSVKVIGDGFLESNSNLKEINIENAEDIGKRFLHENDSLEEISLDKVKIIHDGFMFKSTVLNKIKVGSLEYIGNYFLNSNSSIVEFIGKNIEVIGNNFMQFNMILNKIELPIVKEIGKNFLTNNNRLNSLCFPEVLNVGNSFLENCNSLRKLDLPKVVSINNYFCSHSDNLSEINIPSVMEIGDNFLITNNSLKEIDFPNVKIIGNNFCKHNTCIERVNFPKLVVVGDYFLMNNLGLEYIKLLNIKHIGNSFLFSNRKINTASFGDLEVLPLGFMYSNVLLKDIDALYVRTSIDNNIFPYNKYARNYFYVTMKEHYRNAKSISKARKKELKRKK